MHCGTAYDKLHGLELMLMAASHAAQDEKSWVLAMKELHKINSYKVPKTPFVTKATRIM
jgi:hypothetical protein